MADRWIKQTDATKAIERAAREGKDEERTKAERRRSGRIKSESVWCNLGMVEDISAGGVRIRSRRSLEGEQRLELAVAEHHVELRARVAWVAQEGRKKHCIGLEFIDVTDEQARMIRAIAFTCRSHSKREDAA